MGARRFPRRAPWITLVVVLAGAGSAWASDPSAEARLEHLRALDHRVGAIAHRLSVADLEVCAVQRLTAGWTLHVLGQYGPALRDAARRRFNLAGQAPGIMAVVPDGPAARAGLRPGDRLLAIGERRLGRAEETDAAGQARPDAFEAQMQAVAEALNAEQVSVRAERAGRAFQVTLNPVLACASDFQVTPSPALRAGADGRQVSITSGLVDYAADDDDLALILGHELAHNILGHAERLNRQSPARRWLGGWAASPAALRLAEQEADLLGLRLAARAGFDVSAAPAFWRRLARDHPSAAGPQWGHPSAESRALAAEDALDAIRSAARSQTPP